MTRQALRDAILVVGARHPQFLLLWDRVRARVQVDARATKTACVDTSGTTIWNPEFVAGLSSAELAGVLCHELLHLLLAHHARQGGRDSRLWNLATDGAINHALREDGITLPACAVYPPPDYAGTIQAEPLFDFLAQNPPNGGDEGNEGGDGGPGEDGEEEPVAGAGCGVRPAPGEGDKGDAGDDGQGAPPPALRAGETWEDVRALVEATLAQVGAGSSAVRRLLQGAPARTPWRALLRRGCQIAQGSQVRERPTYSRASRRQLPGILRPGWVSTSPRVAVVIDVSGSMDRSWVESCVSECQSLVRTWPGLRVYVATHTDELVWSGWISEADGASRWEEATGATGGTDPAPAFRAVERAGAKFDATIHFTDCELVRWERADNGGRHLIGACGPGADGRPFCPFPEWAEVVPVAL